MAIQPIDLQTLYSQIEKIGKTQVQQQLAAQTAREAEMTRNKLEAAEKQKTVQEMETGDQRAGVVHEKSESGTESFPGKKKNKSDTSSSSGEETTEEFREEIIRDPSLGTKIDISG